MSRPPLHMITISSREGNKGGPAPPSAFTWWAFRVWTRSRGGETNPVIASSRNSSVSGLHVVDHHHIPNEKHLRKERGNGHRHTHTQDSGRFFCTTHCTFYCHLCHQQHRHIIIAATHRIIAGHTHTTTTYTNELKVEIEFRNNLILTRAPVTITLPHIIRV